MIWVDGQPQAPDAPHVSARDRGFTLADGLFETMRVHRGTIFRLERHLTRLRQGLAALEIPEPAGLRGWLLEAARATGEGEGSLRLTVTRGIGPAGLAPPSDVHPTCIITAGPLPVFPAEIYERGLTAHVASGRRNEHAMTAGLKTIGYTDAVVALLEARRAGADEALFLDTAGHLSEASASNLFIWTGRTLLTPPISCGALPGVTRSAVLELAAALGVANEERAFGPDDLSGAGEAFLTSSLRGIAPLVRVDGAIGRGTPGALTRQLADAYAALVERECANAEA